MEFVRLGRTNLEVSVAGLGCGGHSRLGMAKGASAAQASDIVRRAIDLGINFIDTALVYRTEEAVALGIKGRDRSKIFISSKSWAANGAPPTNAPFFTAAEVAQNLNTSLKNLKTDYIDVYHLHGVMPRQYEHAVNVLLPELKRQQEAGKIRYLAISEAFINDTDHTMFQRALPENHFDVVMVGFNLLNSSARKSVFPLTIKHDVGTLIMFAVRRALNNPEHTREAVADLIAKHEIDPAMINPEDPLDFLRASAGIKSQIEAAYRFCRHEPGAHVILTGTSSAAHLEENVQSILAPPLPKETLAKLGAIFANVISVSGN